MKALKNILEGFDFPNEILVVEYSFGETDDLFAIHLKSSKGVVNLEKCYSAKSVKELWSLKTFPCPVHVLFTGKKVLSKRVQGKSDTPEQELRARAFPSISKENLLFQVDDLENGEYIVSAIRQDIVMEVVDEILASNQQVLDVALGDYTNWSLLAKVAQDKPKVGKFEVNLDSNEVTIAEGKGAEVNLFEQPIASEYSAPFLFGIKSLATRNYRSDQPTFTDNRIEWKYGVLVKKGILVAALFFFTLLLTNFLLFSHYKTKNGDLSQVSQVYDAQFQQVATLSAAYEEKNEFLKVNGATNSQVGMLGDQIASVLPKELSLSKMTFQPVAKILKKENLVRFSRGELQLQGTTENYTSFQDWLIQLRALAWINDIEILGYQETDSRHQADFSIIIKMKDE